MLKLMMTSWMTRLNHQIKAPWDLGEQTLPPRSQRTLAGMIINISTDPAIRLVSDLHHETTLVRNFISHIFR